jgi:hypothetical protein
MSQIAGFLLGTMFLFGSVASLRRRAKGRQAQAASDHWRITRGRVTRSKLLHGNHHTGQPDTGDFQYRYEVDGRTYTSGRVTHLATAVSWSQAIRKYPVGAMVQVSYDPADPGMAVLERDMNNPYVTGWMFYPTQLLILALGVTLTWFFWAHAR